MRKLLILQGAERNSIMAATSLHSIGKANDHVDAANSEWRAIHELIYEPLCLLSGLNVDRLLSSEPMIRIVYSETTTASMIADRYRQ
jgi:hypothetical protein